MALRLFRSVLLKVIESPSRLQFHGARVCKIHPVGNVTGYTKDQFGPQAVVGLHWQCSGNACQP